jgi:hypothetical protein
LKSSAGASQLPPSKSSTDKAETLRPPDKTTLEAAKLKLKKAEVNQSHGKLDYVNVNLFS